MQSENADIQKLKDALTYAEAIINAIHEPLVVLHNDLTIRNANRAFYKTFRLTPSRTVGKSIYKLSKNSWDFPEFRHFIEDILVSRASYDDFEIIHNFSNTGIKRLLLNGRRIALHRKTSSVLLLVIQDITEKKKNEEQVQKQKNILAENHRLQDISRQKDDFMSMASHELKTPVTSIKLFAQLLEKDFTELGNADAASMLSRMNVQITKLTGLIGDLLDVSRMEAGKLQYHFDYFNLMEEVADNVKEIQLTTKTHKIKLHPQTIPPIYGDKDRIGQVLTNFLTNAIKYSPGTHTIEVGCRLEKKYATIYVKDFGMGISKDKRPKVFERFFRVGEFQDNKTPGIGLGLYISSEIIKRHGGIISVKSIMGKGSEFFFKLPLKAQKDLTGKSDPPQRRR
ncbi:MAG: PAS domain-containing sensor histidine kinase [Ginsengibacter sp.]